MITKPRGPANRRIRHIHCQPGGHGSLVPVFVAMFPLLIVAAAYLWRAMP